MVIAGIDPGLDGALAFLETESQRLVAMIGMPTLTLAKGRGSKREVELRSLVILIDRELGERRVGHAFIERVSSSPQMGVTSAFKFGRSYGGVEGVIAALGWPVEYVTPAKWKRAMNVPADKQDARARACQIMPEDAALWTPKRGFANQAECSGRAEAALLAMYGYRTLNNVPAG